MDIVIDLNSLFAAASQSPFAITWTLFAMGGWFPLAIVFLWGAKELWLKYIRMKWGARQKFKLLAIDIPRNNEQTPKAVENMFSYMAGAHGSINLIEKWWEGKFQLSFSLETVSIEGYTQFLIRTPESFRDMVESAVYAQYPDAEITEVNDYTEGIPLNYPDDEYDIYGAEFIQHKNSAYPIKTYKDFENNIGKPETLYKDTMAALMDLCSSLRKGEQFWYQIILIPTDFEWVEIGDNEVKKILKEKTGSKNIADSIVDSIIGFMGAVSEMIIPIWGDVKEKDEKDDVLKMISLKPKEKKQVEAIHDKISKLGYLCKIRVVYVAKKEVMNRPKVFGGFVGFMKQFASLDLNNIKPDTKITGTKASYFFTESRILAKKNKLIRNYVAREDTAGRKPGILNIEELATLWHFPIASVVKAPLIQKAPGRKAEPPMGLPFEEEISGERVLDPLFSQNLQTADIDLKETRQDDPDAIGERKEKKSAPPENLPFA